MCQNLVEIILRLQQKKSHYDRTRSRGPKDPRIAIRDLHLDTHLEPFAVSIILLRSIHRSLFFPKSSNIT